MRRALQIGLLMLSAFAGSACVPVKPYDYTAFHRSNPKSILVLPPLNRTPDVKATNSVWAQTSHPLAESGYYVFPVAVVDETFRQNGLVLPDDIHAVPPAKLREIFGADAALYLEVSRYGTSYAVISSATVVTVKARLMDLRSGETLWTGAASASSSEHQGGSNGLVGMLVQAAVEQIVNTLLERGHEVAGVASERLLTAQPRGLLYGPRSPRYGKDGTAAR